MYQTSPKGLAASFEKKLLVVNFPFVLLTNNSLERKIEADTISSLEEKKVHTYELIFLLPNSKTRADHAK